MAESNIIAHYSGQRLPFPEKLNALDGLPGNHIRRPQFGLNPATGEQWLAIKATATGVMAALTASEEDRELAHLTHPFVLRYERREDCVILIPEFKRFRMFVDEWANNDGQWSDGDRRVPIATAYRAWRTIINPNIAMPLPQGFSYNLAFNFN